MPTMKAVQITINERRKKTPEIGTLRDLGEYFDFPIGFGQVSVKNPKLSDTGYIGNF